MRIDPAIAALQADRGLQRRAQSKAAEAVAAWRQLPASVAVLADLERFGSGAPLEACAALEDVVTRPGDAEALVHSLTRAVTASFAAEPFAQPPLRHGFDGAVSTLQVARAGRAHLVLHAREPGRYDYSSAAFSDGVRHEHVLEGSATGRIVRRLAGTLVSEPIALAPGVCQAFDLASEALQVTEVECRLVSLRLHRFAAEPEPTDSYSLSDGALISRSSGNLPASRHAMMVAVLARMKRPEAAPVLAVIAREQGDTALRWEALREGLALDTATGFAALLAVARAADDPLAAAAGALRAQLIERHPELLGVEDPRCPA